MIKKTTRQILLTAAVLAAAVCFAACNNAVENKTTGDAEAWQQHRRQLYDDSIFPAAAALVRTGDMITRLGSDITSEMLRQLNQTDQSFSHCGIASIENDTVFVYHAIGGEFNPDQKLKRETLYAFGHPSENKSIGIFHTNTGSSQNEQRLVQHIQQVYKTGVPFDMEFDYQTDDRQYCAEFVSKSYTGVTGDSTWLQFSHRGKLTYVSVDNLFLSSFMKEKKRYSY